MLHVFAPMYKQSIIGQTLDDGTGPLLYRVTEYFQHGTLMEAQNGQTQVC